MTITFTDAEDATIIEARGRGLCWVKVGLAIRRQPGDVRKHATADLGLPVNMPRVLSTLRCNVLDRERRLKQLGAPRAESDLRAPLCAGHPMSWGAISAAAYPAYVWAR